METNNIDCLAQPRFKGLASDFQHGTDHHRKKKWHLRLEGIGVVSAQQNELGAISLNISAAITPTI